MKPTQHRVSPTTSVVLDVLRLSLALVVVIGHLTQPMMQDGWPDLIKVAVGSVGGFFVLSGFTIGLLTHDGQAFDLRRYAGERLSRLWSVALPALALTIVCDVIAYFWNPSFYTQHWAPLNDAPVFRMLMNVAFLSQVWGLDVSPFSNSPFWSLSYETGFYAIYGVWLASGPKWRWPATLVVLALLGPNILLMLVFWLAGVGIFHLYRWLSPRGALMTAGISAGAMLLLAATILLGGSSLRAALGDAIGNFVNGYFALFRVSAARVVRTLLFSGFAFTGILVFLLAAAKANDSYGFVKVDGWVKRARQLGEFTFPLYLFHFPLLVVLASLGVYDRTSSVQKVALFCVVCGLCFALTPATVTLKFKLRQLFRLGRSVAPAEARPVQ